MISCSSSINKKQESNQSKLKDSVAIIAEDTKEAAVTS